MRTMSWLLRFAILIGAFALMSLIPGVRLKRFSTAVACAVVFSILNLLLGFVVKFVLVVGTLGLALLALTFLTNLVLLWLTDKLLEDFEIRSFGPLLLATLTLSLASFLGRYLFVPVHF